MRTSRHTMALKEGKHNTVVHTWSDRGGETGEGEEVTLNETHGGLIFI